MRWGRVIIVGVIVALGIWGVSTCMGKMQTTTGSQKSPVATVRSAITAFESMKPEKVTVYFTPIPGRLMHVRLRDMFQNFDKLDIKNMDVMLILDNGVAARVQAVYDMVLTQNGYIDTEQCSKYIKLVKIEGIWYINEAF